jgi:hypothetical protein
MLCIWQKPFAKTISKTDFLDKNLLFAPFTHSYEEENPIQEYITKNEYTKIRDYYVTKGYKYHTSIHHIKKYINIFKELKENDEILIPHRSYNVKADKHKAYHCKIMKTYHYENNNGMYALYCKIKVINNDFTINTTIRKSIQNYIH